jgi:hypothetical protein
MIFIDKWWSSSGCSVTNQRIRNPIRDVAGANAMDDETNIALASFKLYLEMNYSSFDRT